MSPSQLFARIVALVGAFMILLRRQHATADTPAVGAKPEIPEARPQKIPTLKMPTGQGWSEGQKPIAASGLAVNAFAAGLVHPRQILTLPNGDVLTAESLTEPQPINSAFDYAIAVTMKRARAFGPSPNRITLLRDADGDGVAEVRETFLSGQRQPYGMALQDNTLYIGNTDALMSFPYKDGDTSISKPGKKLMSMKPDGHWTRNLQFSADGKKLYVAVGSLSNIADGGMEVEQDRACIFEFNLKTGKHRIFASGLRNPVGMALTPNDGTLWTVVNERDGLGDETPPDYLTSVQDGGFYGWPFCYWGQTVDDRVPQDAGKVASAITPDFALGGHTASLGLCWLPEGVIPGFGNGMVIGQHGSWNRSKLSGYKVIFVPFENGKPSGPSREILSGFLAPDEKVSYGRPVGVAIGPGPCLLVADDVGDVIWRVTGSAG